MRRSVVVAVVLGLIAFGIGVAPPASAVVVACGQTITTDTVLTADVGPCAGDGILIGTNNITLSLNGRRVLGNADHGVSGEFAGVVLQDRSGVTVRGRGTISGFEAGVMISRGSGNTISSLTTQDNVGIAEDTAALGDGIIAFNSPGNRILNNTVTRNGPYDGIGVLGFGSDNNLIQGNRVYDQYFTGELSQSFGVGIITNPIITFPSPTQDALEV